MSKVIVCLLAVVVSSVWANSEENLLPNMTKSELMAAFECSIKSNNLDYCKKVVECDKQATKRVYDALVECQIEMEIGSNGIKDCDSVPMLPLDGPAKIFYCIMQKTPNFTREEKKDMVRFQNCMQELHEDCKVFMNSKK